MRTLFLIGVLLVGVVLGLVYLTSGERAVRTSGGGAVSAPPVEAWGEAPAGNPETPRNASETADTRRVESSSGNERPRAGETTPGPKAVPAPDPNRPERTRSEDLENILSACVGESVGEDLRDCLRRQLEGLALSPEALAELVCGEVPPDGFDQIMVEEAASLWPASDTAQRIRRFHDACNEPGNMWGAFLQRQAERDPEWLEQFGASLRTEDLLGGEDLVLLFCAKSLADMGHASMAELLDQCAHGELGAGDSQVAYSITNGYTARAEAGTGLDFLLSVANSPSFQGRPGEVKALARSLLGGSAAGVDPARTFEAVRGVLADPVAGPGVASHVLDLALWNRMPDWLTDAQRTQLVEEARSVR